MIEIDEISHLVTVMSECTLREIEEELKSRRLTLGYFVPPKNDLTVEEALSRRCKNLYGTFYGELSDLCVALNIHAHDEKNFGTFLTPRQAAGPDWKNFILGSGRSLGFIYSATLKIFPSSPHALYLEVGLAHDIASHQLEREFIRDELKPFVFGHFGNMQVPKGLRLAKSSLILLTAWKGSKDYLDACKRELEVKLEGRYVWRWIEKKNLQKTAEQMLHEKYPAHSWGAVTSVQGEQGRVKLEKEVMEALSNVSSS